MNPGPILRTTKLYADLVTDDGTVCVAVLVRVRLPGITRVLGEVELYHSGGDSEVIRALRADDPDSVTAGDSRLAVEMDLPSGPFTLRYEHPPRRIRPPGTDPVPGLGWSVASVRSPGVARLPGGGGHSIRGEGYVDRVECEGLPRRLGLGEVVWGRAHGASVTAVYTGIRTRSGRQWRRAATWNRGDEASDPVWHEAFRLAVPTLVTGLTSDDGKVTLGTGSGRILRQGALVDRRRAPGFAERTLLRLMLGPGAQIRRLDPLLPTSGSGEVDGNGPGWILHEQVRFGSHLTAA